MPFTIDPAARPWSDATIKKSRFVARLRYVDSEAGVDELLAVAREADRGAGHHCFAYVIGYEIDSCRERYSDDGEPAGTAGAPMLHLLKSRELVNVAAVVSRNYGGIKLGAGGLVRAYSGALAAAIDTVPIRPRVRMHAFELAADHAEAGWIEAELRARGFEISGSRYGQQAVFTVLCADSKRLETAVLELTSGSGLLVPVGHIWR